MLIDLTRLPILFLPSICENSLVVRTLELPGAGVSLVTRQEDQHYRVLSPAATEKTSQGILRETLLPLENTRIPCPVCFGKASTTCASCHGEQVEVRRDPWEVTTGSFRLNKATSWRASILTRVQAQGVLLVGVEQVGGQPLASVLYRLPEMGSRLRPDVVPLADRKAPAKKEVTVYDFLD